MISKPTVNLATANDGLFLAAFDETHAHARGLACDLTGEPRRAGPATKTRVVAGGWFTRGITMRAPAIAIFGSGQFGIAAQLRTAGESAGIVRLLAIPQCDEDIPPADLVAEEMRRCRHDRGIGRFFRHPVDAREMKAAD